MDYNSLLNNVNNPQWCSDTAGLETGKDLLDQGGKGPWWYESDVSGKNSIIVFSDHFIYVVREALSTDCMANMFEDEAPIYLDYVAYVDCVNQGGICTGYETQIDVIEALDRWISDEIQCLPHPTNQGCGETEHTWNECVTTENSSTPPCANVPPPQHHRPPSV